MNMKEKYLKIQLNDIKDLGTKNHERQYEVKIGIHTNLTKLGLFKLLWRSIIWG